MDSLLQQAQSLAEKKIPSYLPIPKRIGYVVSHGCSYASHGYAVRTQGIASALNSHGLETLCFVRPGRPWELDQSASVKPEVVIDGVRYIHSRWQKPHGEKAHLEASVKAFVELFTTYRPEAVIAASNWIVGLPVWIAAKQLGLPFYNEVRGFWELSREAREPGYIDNPEFKKETERDSFVAQKALAVFTLNHAMKAELIKRGVDEHCIALVPNGVGQLPEIKLADPALKQKLGFNKDEKIIGYIGSFSAYEGLDTLLDACAKLVQQGEKIKLLLVGDDQPLTLKLSDSSKTKSLSDHPWVIQVGRVPHEQVGDYYALVDAIVIPRKKLTVCDIVPPMKVVEAMAYGKRMLVSDVDALKEYAEKYDHVLTFKADNVGCLASELIQLLRMPAGKVVKQTFDTNVAPLLNVVFEKNKNNIQGANAIFSDNQHLEVVINHVAYDDFTRIYTTGNANTVKLDKANQSSNLKAVAIMDEISEECWRYEFKSFPINRKNYQEQIKNSTADFCFLESCWKGNRGTWEYAFTSPGLKHANAQALLDLMPRVKEKMPLVFWNKEDPMHYDKYLPIAKFADIIFTTDSLKVDDYKRDVPTADVYAVPFAAQQKICNPSDRFRTEPESVCFAGSYYGEGHDERKRQMHALLPSIIEFNGAIYDRFSKLNNDRYKFPDEFQPFIRDAVPFDEIVKLYKKFKVFLNVNTIIDSPTMMSRRVYELLACGTPVVSTPSKAIEAQFPGIVHMADDAKQANKIIEKLLTDQHYWERTSHRGYREVMTKHTYSHRLQSIKQSLGYNLYGSTPLVSIITCTCRPNMIDRIVENMTMQLHPNCELILMLQDFSRDQRNELITKLNSKPSNIQRIEVMQNDSTDITLGERFNHAATHAKGEYIAKMDDDDFYFEHYLSDSLIPFSFGDYGMVGKKELFMYLSGSNKLIKRFAGMRHRVVDFVAGPTFVVKKNVFDQVKFESRNTGEDSTFIKNIQAAGYKVYAADPYNFIQFRADPKNHTWRISDEEILNGKQSVVISDNFNKAYCDF